MENSEEVRSRNSEDRVYLRFVNLTNRNVELVWVNYTGQFVKYSLLKHGYYVNIDTFKTHPWIAFDSETKERLWLDRNFTYYPLPLKERYPQENLPERTRLLVKIVNPLISLRMRLLYEISKFLENSDDCNKLELPLELVDDIKKIIRQKNSVAFV